ncbi:hypothetical protein [Zobellia nedashkovskayae]|uniref:hypothetical protein n=1 Tax=Zobellia nedashkovskayae TaxID=2779510 RepID=UPI00188DC3ED|nr:hypothetical protein [Zobellia nedashkovskayae]
MKIIRTTIEKNVSGKKVLFLFVLTNLVYILMLTITIPKVVGYANGMRLLDMMPTGYDPNYVKALFNALGPQGRDAYIYRQLPVDMVYPALFGISYCLVLAYFFKKLNKLNSKLFFLCLLPLFAGLADYLENIGIINLLANYPNLTSDMVRTASVFSLAKSGITTLYFIILLVALIFLGIKSWRRKTISMIS